MSRNSEIIITACEPLERRMMLCAEHMLHQEKVVELAPQTIDPQTGISPTNPSDAADPADIVWVNRGLASDNFDARFGASANLARGVVDAVIDYYELMIGSFNYPTAGQTYNLTVSMNAGGSGFGGSGGFATSLGGKPKSGNMNLGAGNGSADPNDDNGWFLDPTPFDNSEFMGNIVNAYAGDAQAGSPAANRADFFTLIAVEMAHCMGLLGDRLAGWHNMTTNTGIPDTNSPPGFFWVFDGPSIKHLLTSDNGGFQDWGSAVHSAEGPGATINFGGFTWVGADDIGNPFYENGRRYMVGNTFALMFKDAYGYSTRDPAPYRGTFYSSPIEWDTGIVRVRGGAGNSADNIQIFRSAGNQLTVSVDIGDDVPGTGALSGGGNLPPFVTVYPAGGVLSVVVDAGGGDDVILLDSTNVEHQWDEPVIINAGAGNDTLTTTFFARTLDVLAQSVTFNGDTGTDSIELYDNLGLASTYSVTDTTVDRAFFGGLTYGTTESLYLHGQNSGTNFEISSTHAGTNMTLEGGNGQDIFWVGLNGQNAEGIDGELTIRGMGSGSDADVIYYNDRTANNAPSYTVEANRVLRQNNAPVSFDTVENFYLIASDGNNSISMNFALGVPVAQVVAVYGNDGNDTIQIDVTANAAARCYLNGDAGTDSLVINDSRQNVGFGTGLHDNAFFIAFLQHDYATFESFTWNASSGNDGFSVFSTNPATPVTINAGGGNDTFQVGGFGGFQMMLDPIDGNLTLNAGPGNDVLYFHDSSDSSGRNYALYANLLAGGGHMADVGYSGFEAVNFQAGTGNDGITVRSTSPEAPLSINTGPGSDDVAVLDNSSASPVFVDGQADAGTDRVYVNSDNIGLASVLFSSSQTLAELNIGDGGTATLSAGGAKVIDTDGLTIAATGKLDLNDNDLIVDYASASQLAAVQAAINSARNGGAWNGFGITSSTAAASAQHNTTLGAMESADFKSVHGAGALFAGRDIDPTAVVVKYTYYGDADINGGVDFDDYVRTDGGFNNNRSGWLNGDFDGNGSVDFDDYVLLDLGFNTQSGTL